MNSIQTTYEFIRSHPLGSRHKLRCASNWITWQLRSRLGAGPHVVSFVGPTRLLVSKGMHGATGNIYCGLHEFSDMAFVLHFLRPNDWFVDVGANVGSYSMIAAGVCGAHTVAIEPVGETADALAANVALNRLEKRVRIERCALGDQAGRVRLSNSLDCTNRVVADDSSEVSAEVPQRALDDLLGEASPCLIKIDVEGYEYRVLRGARRTLAASALQAVIVEANGSGKRYGFEDQDVFDLLQDNGFRRARYDPFERSLDTAELGAPSPGNALFVKNESYVQGRLVGGAAFEILGETL